MGEQAYRAHTNTLELPTCLSTMPLDFPFTEAKQMCNPCLSKSELGSYLLVLKDVIIKNTRQKDRQGQASFSHFCRMLTNSSAGRHMAFCLSLPFQPWECKNKAYVRVLMRIFPLDFQKLHPPHTHTNNGIPLNI